ncbi:hypothetical protein AP060_00043 [Pseudomonas sp. TAD18]|nr:hypothetical protein AP059_00041 [Pseudomonas sp. TAA207]KVV12919.1 hypothetical protein AP060_00043 [Pseudomonas sp. TAD18]
MLGRIGEAPHDLATGIQDCAQVAGVGIPVSYQRFSAFNLAGFVGLEVQPIDLTDPLCVQRVIVQVDGQMADGINHQHQPCGLVIHKIEGVAVTVAEAHQARALRVMRIGFEDLIQAIVNVFDYGQAVAQLIEAQAVKDADKAVAGVEAAQFQTAALGVDIHPQITTVRVGNPHDLDVVKHAPARPEQAGGADVLTVVLAGPLDRQSTRQREIDVFGAILELAAGGDRDRVALAAVSGDFSGQQHADNQPGNHPQLVLAAADFAYHQRLPANSHIRGYVEVCVDRTFTGGPFAVPRSRLAVDEDFP